MQCKPIVYLTEFDNRAELTETVKEYILLGWVGARYKPSAMTFEVLKVHTGVAAPNAITKMPPHRVLYVDTSPQYYIVFHGVRESDGDTLKPLTCHSSLPTNMLSICICGNVQCLCRKIVVRCVIYCHKSQVRNCPNRR